MISDICSCFSFNEHPGAPGLPGPWESPVYLPVERQVVVPVYEIGELDLGVSDAGLFNAGILIVLASVVDLLNEASNEA